MIEPDCPGIVHGGPQHAAERIKLPIFETDRIPPEMVNGAPKQAKKRKKRPFSDPDRINPAKPQILPRRIENVRRRADGSSGQDGILITPCVETVVPHADGDIKIKPNWQI